MMKIRHFIYSVFILLASVNCFAQTSGIGFSTWVRNPSCCVDEVNARLLVSKVDQMIARNCAGVTTASSVMFSICPEIILSHENVVQTGARNVYVKRGALSLYVINRVDGSQFAALSIVLEGSGTTESLAMRGMLSRINIADTRFTHFIRGAQDRIIKYYAENLPSFITKAEMYASRQQYEEAVLVLSVIPETVEGYEKVASLMTDYYQKELNTFAKRQINKAKSLLVQKDRNGAIDILAEVDPLSDSAEEAMTLIGRIHDEIKAEEKAAAEAVSKAQEQAAAERAEQAKRQMEIKRMELDTEAKIAKYRYLGATKYADRIFEEEDKDTLFEKIRTLFKS